MKNQVLSIEQMKSLIQLGIDTSKASMCWIKNTDGDETENKYMLSVHNEWCYEMSCLSPIPTFTLQDILSILPRKIHDKITNRNAHLNIEYAENKVGISYLVGAYVMVGDFRTINDNIINAAYSMLIWAIDHNYLKAIPPVD
ncbi:MAG: hypothetical protein BGO84_14190 [Dysgonomonas sp. 37-18]|nr:MAG: hypothetical protein BGO84_14190 [Dysgonomonas sp. 37-18]